MCDVENFGQVAGNTRAIKQRYNFAKVQFCKGTIVKTILLLKAVKFAEKDVTEGIKRNVLE
jgi:hypothetical protein